MTGFGRGVAEQGGLRATVDIRAVNHRFLDLKLRGASLAPAVEEAVNAKVRSAVERGAVTVSINVARASTGGGSGTIDMGAAAAAHAQLSELAQRLGVPGPDLALVLAQPGVSGAAERIDEEEAPVLPALEAALAQLDQMRRSEGAALAAELGLRFDELVALRLSVASLAAGVPAQVTKRLQERLGRLLEGQDLAIDPARLAQEVAMLADRADVTEELVRLASHLDQARALVAGPGAVGRRLDFLVQEIGRELNTIGSKSTVTEISAAIVEGKASLEKVREQIQNVE
jgi:uncharacterized protein (TIGR00255 family)